MLGATGSVGEKALAVARNFPDRLVVRVLAARGTRLARLAELAAEFRPRHVVVGSQAAAVMLRPHLPPGVGLDCGAAALKHTVADGGVDLVLNAIVGAAGLGASAAALAAGADLALANKEAMVAAGPLLRRLAGASGARILPVDSEHAAIHQALRAGRPAEVRRLVLTASGGPFLNRDPATLSAVTPDEATAHPTWNMGSKISVDSATLMNKGLELIEASYLFETPESRIDIVIHPQSLVHSMVEFRDGSSIAQLSENDMAHPVQYALSCPERWPAPDRPATRVADLLVERAALEFFAVEPEAFPAPTLAREALRTGCGAPAALNAANETAVAAFLGREAPFTAIVPTAAEVLERHGRSHRGTEPETIDEVREWDAWGRRQAREVLTGRRG